MNFPFWSVISTPNCPFLHRSPDFKRSRQTTVAVFQNDPFLAPLVLFRHPSWFYFSEETLSTCRFATAAAVPSGSCRLSAGIDLPYLCRDDRQERALADAVQMPIGRWPFLDGYPLLHWGHLRFVHHQVHVSDSWPVLFYKNSVLFAVHFGFSFCFNFSRSPPKFISFSIILWLSIRIRNWQQFVQSHVFFLIKPKSTH